MAPKVQMAHTVTVPFKKFQNELNPEKFPAPQIITHCYNHLPHLHMPKEQYTYIFMFIFIFRASSTQSSYKPQPLK